MKRVLFFGEPATLAHVARPVVLAAGLDRQAFQVAVATGSDFRWLADQAGLEVLPLASIGTSRYLAAVAAGRVVFPYRVLEDYVQDDLRLIETFRPDVVVGDFRLSLAVSARLARVPFVCVVNAYWSPYAAWRPEIPVHPATRLLGVGFSNAVFRVISPLVMAQHALPMYRLRRAHGMPSLGLRLQQVFSEGDITVFPDVPEMVPTAEGSPPGRYRYIGPVVWSPPGDLPDALASRDQRRPLVFVALGSSGDPGLLRTVLAALGSMDLDAVVATGNHGLGFDPPPNVAVHRFLPGDAVARIADLVVCNGGSPSTHQALCEGTPVIGLPANLDQLLNMQAIIASGAGLSLRADQVTQDRLCSRVRQVLSGTSFQRCGKRLQSGLSAFNATREFRDVLDRITS